MPHSFYKYSLLLAVSTFFLNASEDTELTKTNNMEVMQKTAKEGTHKQKLFLSLNPNITEEIIDTLLENKDNIISSTLKENEQYKNYMLKKQYIRNKKQQEIIKNRKTIRFYVKDLNKIKNVLGKYHKTEDPELKIFYNKELLGLIDEYKDVFYKLDDLDINRLLAESNISQNTIDFLLGVSKHKEDFIVRKNIILNKNIKTAEFEKYFEKEQNNFLVFHLKERGVNNQKNENYENQGSYNKINVENEDKTDTNVILVL